MTKSEKSEPDKTPESSKPGEYKVGNCNPPLEHQFKPNNIAGKGRKSGSKGTKKLVEEALGMKVMSKIGGKTKKLSKFELSLHQLANKASGGDLKAIEKVIALQERYGPPEETEAPSLERLKLDQETLRDFLAHLDMLNPPEHFEGRNNGDA
jgi:hypothetical protein